ncbi:MAG TPA: FtsH protease activity modulator HflK [Balneolaceae bacterium]|nr:FtsH protease activity modulator HflK [Balneolaceae bacterium]|tara:strand:+ start:49133 stop:50128 length:996 start_codon:yes stop_codon:yes gene_type:complete
MAQEQEFEFNLPPQFEKITQNIRLMVVLLVGVAAIFSSVFTVETEEVGVITRFGEYVDEAQPGLNFKIPFVDQVQLVPVKRQLKLEFGYRTTEAGVNSSYRKAGYGGESLMLTGDLNLGDVEWVVQYRIDNPYNYLFKIREVDETMRDVSEAAMRQVVGDRTVDEVITEGRAELANETEIILQQIVQEYEMGIRIDQVLVQDVNPPDPVKPSYNGVNEAEQQRETLINEARADYNRVIPRAAGEAEQTIQQAEGYALNRVNTAKGEVSRFNDLYSEYIKAPEVTKTRIFLETMEDILPKMGQKIITDEEGNSVIPLLQLQMDGVKKANGNQ